MLLVALAAFAYYALFTPLVTPPAILATVAVCVTLTLTSAVAVISLLVSYPLILGALFGAMSAPRQPPLGLTEQRQTEHHRQTARRPGLTRLEGAR